MSTSAPAWARRVLRWVVPGERVEDVLGDLEEAHALRHARLGRRSAWVRTSLEAADVAFAFLRYRIRDAAPRAPGRLSWPEIAGAFRALRTQPVLAFAATLALATGIGIATTGYGFVDSLLWGRVPWPGGDRFVLVTAYSEPDGESTRLDADTYRGMVRETGFFEHVGLLDGTHLNLEHASGEIEPLPVERVSPSLFQAIPARPVLGRLLLPPDAAAGAPPVVLLRESLWERRFEADPAVVGRTVRLSGAAYTVVGVMPDAYPGPSAPEAWVPFPEPGPATLVEGRAFAVLRTGVDREAVRARVEAMEGGAPRSGEVRVRVERLHEALVNGPFRLVLLAMLGVLVLLLLVVAANVANLFYARATARSAELAVRTALGASRARLVTQLGVEVTLIAALAAAAGLAASQATMGRVQEFNSALPWLDFSLDASKIGFLVGATLLAVAVAGVWPALRATRRDPAMALRRGSRGAAHGLGRAGAAMIVVQMAVSVALIGVATVFARGFTAYALPQVALPRGEIMSGWVNGAGHPPAQAFVDALAGVPGVAVASATTFLPRQDPERVRVEPEEATGSREDRPAPTTRAHETAARVGVLPGYFDVLGAAPLAGRVIAPADMEEGAAPVTVVNDAFVRDVLGGGEAVGRRIVVDGVSREIVGVVPDLGIGLVDPTRAAGLYVPLTSDVYQLVVRAGDPLRLTGQVRSAVAAVDPSLSLGTLLPLERIAEDNVKFMRGVSVLFAAVGAVAMLLSLVTLYALTSYAVTRRTREIGIRVALGEGYLSVARTVVGGTALQLAAGAALGSALGWLALRGESFFTFGLPPAGPWTFPGVALGLALAAAAASWKPVRRALAIQPMEALRQE
ncbi:MAG TPA: ABC transporter permease [Longimicrobiales bacterium]|nr:ABC transporter permease [Longimicrobiales bacterium]